MQKQAENKAYIPLIALFCAALLAVPVYWLVTPRQEFSAMEKRYLAEPPELKNQDLTDWTFSDEMEAYLADQLPLRDLLVGMDAYMEEASGRQVASEIWVDKDGYLMERPVEQSPEQLAEHLRTLNEFALANGITATLMVPPSTGYVRQSRLPRAQRIYEDAEILAQIREADLPGIAFLDLTDALAGDMFYRTDHHWNAKGAYAAYLRYAAQRGYEPFAPEEFTITTHEEFYGTTYARSALWLTQPDTLEMWDLGRALTVSFSDAQQTYDSLFFPKYLGEHDQYPVFLDGNHPLTTVCSLDDRSGKTLLLIKDSFANSLTPLLVGHYAKIILVDPRYDHDEVSQLVREQSVDEILIVYSLDHIVNDADIDWLK